MDLVVDDKYSVYFKKFLCGIESIDVTKENVKSAFSELKKHINNELSDEELFDRMLLFLEKKIDEDKTFYKDIGEKNTKGIHVKIKIFKKNPNTERYKLTYGYLTTLAAETMGNFYLKSNKAMDYIGIELEKGNLIVNNGGIFVGKNMSGGSVHILGNTNMFAGQRMTGGNIKIDGTGGVCLGDGMTGGEIYAKTADKTANKSENVVVEKLINVANIEISEEDIKKYIAANSSAESLITKYDLKRYAEEANKSIGEWEERKVMSKNERPYETSSKTDVIEGGTSGAYEEDSKAGKANNIHADEDDKKRKDGISLSNIMEEIYGKVDVSKVEGIDYMNACRRDKKQKEHTEFLDMFVASQKDEKEGKRYADENFERLLLNFKYKDVTKKDIVEINLQLNDIKKILKEVTPLTLLEKTIFGYLTSIAAEKIDIAGETLFIENERDYIGIEMKNGKISVKNAGEYLGKNMCGGEIIVENDSIGNVGEGMSGGRIEIRGNVYGDYVGWRMTGGEILIKHNGGNFVGLKMTGGKITIEKHAGNGIGERMEGGEILIRGRCGITGKGMKKGIIWLKEGIASSEREGGEIYTL